VTATSETGTESSTGVGTFSEKVTAVGAGVGVGAGGVIALLAIGWGVWERRKRKGRK
jgi:hypothetical protein